MMVDVEPLDYRLFAQAWVDLEFALQHRFDDILNWCEYHSQLACYHDNSLNLDLGGVYTSIQRLGTESGDSSPSCPEGSGNLPPPGRWQYIEGESTQSVGHIGSSCNGHLSHHLCYVH